MLRTRLSFVAIFGFAALICSPSTVAGQATAPSLGAAQSFAVLSGTASVSSTGPSQLNGDLGTSGVAGITGFGGVAPNNGSFTGGLHNGDALAGQAQLDAITQATSAFNDLRGRVCADSFGATILGVTTIGPGVHCYASTVLVNGPVTLDAGGDPNAVFVFNLGSDLTTAVNSRILLTGSAQACNVFWTARDAVIEVGSTFVGNVLDSRDITVKTNAHVFGRVLAGRAITLDTNIVDATVCAAVAGGGGGGGGTPAPAPCVPTSSAAPTITSIPSQVIPTLPVGGSVAVGFTISGAVITDALTVRATSSDTTLIPAGAMVITKGIGGARVLTIFGADGRSGVATITVTVTDGNACTPTSTSTTFQLTIGTAVPTLPQWWMIALTLLLALAGFAAMRRRST